MATTKETKKRKRMIRRKIKRLVFKALMIMLVVGALVGLWKATYYWPDQKVKSAEKIQELEGADQKKYEDIKAMFTEEIENRTGKQVESVVFYVSAFDSYWDYTAEVYYKADGEWYTYTADEDSRRINTKLENKLINLLF